MHLLVMAGIIMSASSPIHAGLLDGLAVYYKFDGSGADSSGNGCDVGLYGGVGFAPGIFGTALDLHHNGSQLAQRPADDPVLNLGAADFHHSDMGELQHACGRANAL